MAYVVSAAAFVKNEAAFVARVPDATRLPGYLSLRIVHAHVGDADTANFSLSRRYLRRRLLFLTASFFA